MVLDETMVKKKGEYAAIFYKKNQLSLLDSGNFWLSPTPERASLGWDAACIRICTWGKFQDKVSGKQFYFFNTHMDHVGYCGTERECSINFKTH